MTTLQACLLGALLGLVNPLGRAYKLFLFIRDRRRRTGKTKVIK